MSTLAGYTNAFLTPYGVANFWVVTGWAYFMNTVNQTPSMNITLSGFPTEDDANNGAIAIGVYTFFFDSTQIDAIFSGTQSIIDAALQAQSVDWAGAVFVPAT